MMMAQRAPRGAASICDHLDMHLALEAAAVEMEASGMPLHCMDVVMAAAAAEADLVLARVAAAAIAASVDRQMTMAVPLGKASLAGRGALAEAVQAELLARAACQA